MRQTAHLVSQAADQRDKACRDARQTAAIAYNDVGKLTEQLLYLDRNVLAIEKGPAMPTGSSSTSANAACWTC